MRIENLRFENSANSARVMATVIWEDCDRPRQEIFYETPEAFARDLTCNPHAFLVGSLMPAIHHGEKRIAIDGEICPELRNGLVTAMGLMQHWYGADCQPLSIETRTRTRLPTPRTSERAGSFLSGGVDSLAMLRANRLDLPPEHPRSIRDCLLVHGFDIGGNPESGKEEEMFELAWTALVPIAENAGVTLIPVHTNIRYLDPAVRFWMDQFFGAALASVAHVFSGRLTTAFIASGLDIPNLQPHGSHPLLDPNYSSADLQIRHDLIRLSRLQRVELISGWDIALANLRVCTMNPAGKLNCGKCDKCLRTMMELLAVRKLAFAPTFPVRDVSAEMLQDVSFEAIYDVAFYQETVGRLIELGRLDLVEVINAKAKEYQKRVAWEEERDWKGALKRFDRRYLNSRLFSLYKTVRTRIPKQKS